jgi:hypothetical protein
MSDFTDALLGYELFDTIVIRVSAENVKGRSDYNSATFMGTTATVKTIPEVMPSATITRGALTTEDLLQIEWTELITASETGDSPILSYSLEYDQGTNSWVTVIGDPENYLLNSVIITDGVVAGTLYTFRIRAKNVYGWSLQYSYPYI